MYVSSIDFTRTSKEVAAPGVLVLIVGVAEMPVLYIRSLVIGAMKEQVESDGVD